MSERVQHRLPDLGEELAKRAPVIHRGAQDDRVDEKPDNAFQLGPVPPSDDRADRDVVLAGPPVEQHLARGGQRHEQRAIVLAGQRLEPLTDLRRHHEVVGGPGGRAHRRPGAVGRQLQWRDPG